MKAVYKNELSTYFTTLTGYVFCAFLLLFAGIYTTLLCLKNQYVEFEYVLGNMCFVFFIIVNILLLIAGCFLDSTSALYIFTPLFVPGAQALGIDMIHLGVVMIVNLAIGGVAGDDLDITTDKPAYFESDWVRVWQAKPAKPDTVRIFSMNFGTCMVRTSEDKLALGDCNSDAAIVTITPLSSTTYRFNFGELSIDIPNESKDAGVTMSLYKWNGGDHQKVVMEKQSGYEGSVVRMKMLNSGMYLRATTDGERVVQSWSDDWEWYQMWRLLGKDDTVPTKDSTKKDTTVNDSGTTAIPYLGDFASAYGTSVHFANNNLFI